MGPRTEKIWNRLGQIRIAGHLSAAAVLVSYPLLVVAALTANHWLFIAMIAVSYVAETLAYRIAASFIAALSQIYFGVTFRFVLREAALLLLLIQSGYGDTVWFALFLAATLALHVARAAHSGMALYITRRRRLPIVTRRLDLSKLKIPDAPPRFLFQGHVRTMLHLDLLAMAGGAIALVSGHHWAAPAGAGLAMVLGFTAAAAMLPHALRARPLADGKRVIAVVNEQIRRHRPQVALYFSGSLDSVYQINMWLSTLDRLDRPALIILRERGMVPLLARTSSPVVCVPAIPDLPLLDLSTVRLCLFAANAEKNLHLLRVPEIKSVFVNHGDSDKAASFNPFSQVYDQVWVAGPAGRARYHDMRAGVRDDEIVEVGRPQLAPIHTDRPTPDPMLTVLYAPTWEGWTGDRHCSSVATMGPAIVAALLKRAPQVRVLYKPHPMTGIADPAAAKANDEIIAMLKAANAARDDTPATAPGEAAARRLDALTTHLAALSGSAETATEGADEAQLSRDGARGGDDAEWRQTADAWNEAYWAAEGWWRHRAVTGLDPDLYQCFNRCDLLITDVSSVVTDFVASGKPYAVTNVAGIADEEFRTRYPTAAAGAYLISPDCAQLPDVLTEVEKDGPDRMTRTRQELKPRLLGPEEPGAMTGFDDAVTALLGPAGTSSGGTVPGQSRGPAVDLASARTGGPAAAGHETSVDPA